MEDLIKTGFMKDGKRVFAVANENSLAELGKALDRIKELEAENKWISVEDRLPEKGVNVLYYFKHVGTHIGMCDGTNSFYGSAGWLIGDVTHWMPLPEPPDGSA